MGEATPGAFIKGIGEFAPNRRCAQKTQPILEQMITQRIVGGFF
jgi:hypothetical protein